MSKNGNTNSIFIFYLIPILILVGFWRPETIEEFIMNLSLFLLTAIVGYNLGLYYGKKGKLDDNTN